MSGPEPDAHAVITRAYEHYAADVGAYALRRTGAADAADVVADTFLVAWRRRDELPPEPHTLPWLYGVARRVLANQYRSRDRRGRLHDRLRSEFTEFETKSDRVEQGERIQEITDALGRLSERDAELLRLAAWEGLGPTDIATVMGLDPRAARQRLHRARARFRRELGADDSQRRGQPAPRTEQPTRSARLPSTPSWSAEGPP